MNETITGAEALIRGLVAEGVDRVFGYPGGFIIPVYDQLYHYTDKLTHVLTRHEQGAIHAAQGYARASHRPGVVIVTSGPGATNLITGLSDAMMDSTPLVVITGQAPSSMLGTDAFSGNGRDRHNTAYHEMVMPGERGRQCCTGTCPGIPYRHYGTSRPGGD